MGSGQTMICPGDAIRFDGADRPAFHLHSLYEQQPAKRGRALLTMRHKSLLSVWLVCTPTEQRRSQSVTNLFRNLN
jgi:hypothetical protein